MKRFLKIFGFVLLGIFILLIGIIIFLQTPAGQRMLKNYAVEFLEKKFGTQVSIEEVSFTIPKNIQLKGVLFLDKNNDTLLSLKYLDANIAMLELLSNKLKVNSLDVEGLYAYMYRPENDTVYNYQFIIDAFSDTSDVQVKEEEELGTVENGKAQSMLFLVSKVRLKDITFIMDDRAGGMYFDVKLDSLFLKPKEINPGEMIYLIDELYVHQAHSNFRTFPGTIIEEKDTSTSSTPLILSVNKLVLTQSSYRMLTEPDSFYLYAGLEKLNLDMEIFDLEKSLIKINDVLLEDATNEIVMGTPTGPLPKEEIIEEINDSDTSKWRIYGNKLVLNNVYFKMDDNSAPRYTQGMDYSHMDFSKVFLIMEDLNYLTDSIFGDLQHVALEEKSGLKLITLRTHFFYHNKGAELNQLFIQTPESIIRDKARISYPSLDAIAQKPELLFTDIHFEESTIAINDILLFSPESLLSTLSPYKNQKLTLDGALNGYLSNLRIQDIQLEGLDRTKIYLDGVLTGLPDTDRMRYDFSIVEISSGSKDILPFIPESLASSFSIPESIDIKGNLKGSIYDYYPELYIKTSDGDIALNGNVNISTGAEKYNLSIATNHLNIGKIIKNDTLIGTASINGKLVGTSFDPNKMNATLIAEVDQLEFNGYNYTRMQLNAGIQNQIIEMTLHSKDFNANMDIYAVVDIRNEYPSVESSLKLNRVDVQKLGFYEEALELAGTIDLNFSSLNPDYPTGYINWMQPKVILGEQEIMIDSVFVSSNPSSDSGQNIIAYIPRLLDARLKGRLPLTQIGTVTLQHINKYFVFNPNLESYNEYYSADLSVEIQHHELLKKFVPELDTFTSMNLSLNMNQEDFDFEFKAPYVSYGDHKIKDLIFTINDSNQALVYDLNMFNYQNTAADVLVNRPMLFGNLKNNLLKGNFKTFDYKDVEHYSVGFNATYSNNRYILSLLPQLKLNYDNWNVDKGNWLAYHLDSGIVVNNIGMYREGESLLIKSSELSYNSPLNLKIKDFKLENVSKILNPDDVIAMGSINADILADFRDTFPLITGDLSIDSFKIYNSDIGRLQANVSNKTLNTFDLIASITQKDNNISLNGQYYMTPKNGNDFLMNLKMESINMQQFEGLALGYLSDSRGFLKGDLELKGTTDKPSINGYIETENLETRVNMLNSFWKFPNERIDFKNQQITFNDFKIYDSLGKYATISGNANMKSFSLFDLNLNFKSDTWMAMNSTNKNYEWMYGKMVVTSNIDITGTSSSPILNGTVKIHDSTNFTYANIDDGPGIADHEGYVVFVEDINNIDTILNDTTNIQKSTAMSMNLNIETEKYATFNVLVNPLSGDMLSVNGAAFLNASMIPGGQFSLSGSYQIEDGYYELNYNLIKRKFKIQEGSSIQLTGDPLEADVNITAAYTTDASAYDLMENSVSQEELVFYKQRMPFDVVLKISGKPLSPIIKYDIVLSEESARSVDKNVADNIQRKLTALRTDVSEMSKQVFGMLVLGRFIADDPIKSGNPVSMEYYARQTASRFLSQQLNNLADKYVSGLDLSLDIESQEDYSTGQRENRTDLNFRASKSLFNDRLKVTIGNDFQIEGRQLPGQQNSLIPGNISLDYRLSKDGKYNVRGYRKNELINVIDGYVVETGMSFMLKYEYNRLRELFYSKEKLRELYRKRREEERRKEQQELEKKSVHKN